jgi:predicted RNA methylase
MDLRLLTDKVMRTVRNDGLLALGRKTMSVLARQKVDAFDKRHGTDTSGIVHLWNCAIDSPNARTGVRYSATGDAALKAAVASLPIDPRDYTFLDLGSGKGRCLIVAHMLGFRRVIGVEFARDLVEVSRRNLVNLGIDAEVVHQDVEDYRLPDVNLVVYMFNPFGERVMASVLERIEALTGCVYVVYYNPILARMVDGRTFLRRLTAPDGFALWNKPRA